jgi:hypothetical protein
MDLSSSSLCFFLLNQPGEMLKRTVKCGFRTFGETAGWKLSALYVVPNAVAANAFSGARVITAVAVLEVLFFFTFHMKSSYLSVSVNSWERALGYRIMIPFCACQSGKFLPLSLAHY